MTYRPAIRCDDRYQAYFAEISKTSTLSLTQIMRLSLFVAPFSPLFHAQLAKFSKDTMETPVPPPTRWEVTDNGLWMEQSYVKDEGKGSGVIVDTQKTPIRQQPVARSAREVCEQPRIKQVGGISFKLG